jgi:hypothetical protein
VKLDCNFCNRVIKVPDPAPSQPPLSIDFQECPEGEIDIRMTLYACTECLARIESERKVGPHEA